MRGLLCTVCAKVPCTCESAERVLQHAGAACIKLSDPSAISLPASIDGAATADEGPDAAALAALQGRPGKAAAAQCEPVEAMAAGVDLIVKAQPEAEGMACVQNSEKSVAAVAAGLKTAPLKAEAPESLGGSAVVPETVGEGGVEPCEDGLYCSKVGRWRAFQLVSKTGLVSPVEEGWQLVKMKKGEVRRVKRGLCIEFEEELVDAKVDGKVWSELRPGEVLRKRGKKQKEAVEGEAIEEESLSEKDRALRAFPVRVAMQSALGLLSEELLESQVEVRVNSKRHCEFWLGEYNRRVAEAGSAEEFLKWLLFTQGMMRQKGRVGWGEEE